MLGSRTRIVIVVLLTAVACSERPVVRPTAIQVTDSIVGTWRAIEFAVRRVGESTFTYPLGRTPRGYLVYDGTGHVFFQVVRPTAADSLRRLGWSEAPDSLLRPLLSGFVGHFGSYVVDSHHRIITHRFEGELLPTRGEWELARTFRLNGDTLVLGDTVRHWVFQRVR